MRLAFKELKHNWKKYILVTVITMLLMFMVIFLSGLVDGLGRAVSSSIELMPAETFILKDDAEGLITVSSVTDEQLEDIIAKASGDAATLDIFRTHLLRADNTDKLDITYFACDSAGFISPEVYSGVKLSDDDNAIVLDDDFEADGIKLGDTVTEPTSGVRMKVVGFTKDQMYGHISVGFVSVGTFTKIMEGINPMYKPVYHAVVLKESNADIEIEGLKSYTKAEIIDKLPGYKAEQMTIKMVDWMLVIITAVVLGVFFFVINIQKEKEYGVMKAIGVSMREITVFILCEVGLVALVGTAVAVVVVQLMAMGLPPSMPFYIQTGNVAVILPAFILISLAGGLFSVVRAAKIDPAEIIGGDS